MKQLELKIHPPIVFVICAGFMWGIAQISPAIELSQVLRKISILIGSGTAIAIALSAIIAFRKVNTTIDPHKPDESSSLVTSGIYQYTRNPMYLGLATLLCMWTIYLANAYAIIGVLGFVAFITQFQIKPEERVLTKLFGEEFTDYQQRVRRWL